MLYGFLFRSRAGRICRGFRIRISWKKWIIASGNCCTSICIGLDHSGFWTGCPFLASGHVKGWGRSTEGFRILTEYGEKQAWKNLRRRSHDTGPGRYLAP